ncbi:MAG: aminoglycoside phosphotransferase family protein [Ignavibacteria bacterium]|nr:aminoglycoside phosphotransferase family protein [Ignavibacteria bacterium]
MHNNIEKELLSEKIKKLLGWKINPAKIRIHTDTTDWMRIARGDVIRLNCGDYIVKGNMREPRFGIDDQPKYWVFSAVDLKDGSEKIIKTVFHEEFYAHIGILKIRCYRNPEKEGKVLQLVRGDHRFMQGFVCYDEKGNAVRVIDFIRGKSFFHYVPSIEKKHEDYFFEDLPYILWKLKDSFKAILKLHENGFCHGDIRNDHIIVEAGTGNYRWIDFDLMQDVSDFDLWSCGNILSYAVAKGLKTFDQVMKGNEFPDEVKLSLTAEDASAFYNYRIMNLKKLYPYIPIKLSNILLHFTIKPYAFYSSIMEFFEDFSDMLEKEFPISYKANS